MKLGIAIIGLGHWGPSILRSIISCEQVQVQGAVECSAERRDFIREKFPQLRLYSDFHQCLDDDTVQALVVATPTETHYQLGLQALEAGKHVLMEKPLAHDLQAAIKLNEIAAKKKLVLMTGHIFLYNQAVIEMKRLVEEGELGRLFYLRSIRSNLGPIRPDVNALWDLAAHDVSIFNYIFGVLPLRVTCTAFSLLGLKQQDIAQGTLEYPDNRVATFFVSWLDPQKQRTITAVGEKKMLTFDDMRPEQPLTIFDKGVRWKHPHPYSDNFGSFQMLIHQGEELKPKLSTGEPLKNECQHFIDCIINNRRPRTDGENGVQVVRVLEALSSSCGQHGALVNV